MTDREQNQFEPFDDSADHASAQRSGLDRRQENGGGFTYVSTVGWICRREKPRRQTDDEAEKDISS